MLTVHVRVNDAATGQPIPARLRLVDPAGVCRMPLGRLPTFATRSGEDVGGQVQIDGKAFAYIDGICEVRLPYGPTQVEVHKGPEYVPLVREVILGPGKIALRLTMERAFDWHALGWYSGDGRTQELSPYAARLEGAAEALDVVNLLACERPPHGDRLRAYVNLFAFSGTRPALDGSPLVVVNTLNVHSERGTVALLNCHRVVYPLRGEEEDWAIADWCDQCHRKKGLVVWPDLPHRMTEHPHDEVRASVRLGKIDAYEICHFSESTLRDWYRFLDEGLRLPLLGSSGKDSNAIVLGCVRTYAHLEPGQEFGYGTWIEAVRAGRTFVTDGPLLSMTVNGHDPGATISLKHKANVVRIEVEAQSVTPFDRLQVLHNGEVVADTATVGEHKTARIEAEIPIVSSGWLAARCLCATHVVRAHTSPLYVVVEHNTEVNAC